MGYGNRFLAKIGCFRLFGRSATPKWVISPPETGSGSRMDLPVLSDSGAIWGVFELATIPHNSYLPYVLLGSPFHTIPFQS